MMEVQITLKAQLPSGVRYSQATAMLAYLTYADAQCKIQETTVCYYYLFKMVYITSQKLNWKHGEHQRAAGSLPSRSTNKKTKVPALHFCNSLLCAQFFWLYFCNDGAKEPRPKPQKIGLEIYSPGLQDKDVEKPVCELLSALDDVNIALNMFIL